MSHSTLQNYFNVMFGLANAMRSSILDLESLPVFERDMYVALLMAAKRE